MSLPQFFLENQVIASEEGVFPLRLSHDDLKHVRALRLTVGEHLALVDAAQDYFECEIVSFDDGVPLVRIARRLDADETLAHVVLVQGVAKGDKMDAVIRHATEVGVSGFIPLACERSIVKLDQKKAQSRAARWRAIAKSAAMQSGRTIIPEVADPMSVSEVADTLREATAVLICWEEAPYSAHLADALHAGLVACGMDRSASDARVAIIVGPEGGLTHDEVDRLLACNPRARLVTLGSSILRTETAGLVASALVIYELGGLGAATSQDGLREDGRGLSPGLAGRRIVAR